MWGGISIAALLGVILIRYYCIKENGVHATETGNSLFKIIGGFIGGGLAGFEWRDENRNFRIIEYYETLHAHFFPKINAIID